MRAAAMPGEDPETLPTPDAMSEIFLDLADPALEETGKKFYARS